MYSRTMGTMRPSETQRKVIDFTTRRRLRDAKRDAAIIDWVVDPSGKIRTVHYHLNLHPAMLDVENAIERDEFNRVIALWRPEIRNNWQSAGYVWLEDLYHDEGRLQDWETFKQFHYAKAARRGVPKTLSPERDSTGNSEYRVKGDLVPIKRKMIGALPDAYLPSEVLRRRALAGGDNVEMVLPPPQKTVAAPDEEAPRGRSRSKDG